VPQDNNQVYWVLVKFYNDEKMEFKTSNPVSVSCVHAILKIFEILAA